METKTGSALGANFQFVQVIYILKVLKKGYFKAKVYSADLHGPFGWLNSLCSFLSLLARASINRSVLKRLRTCSQ